MEGYEERKRARERIGKFRDTYHAERSMKEKIQKNDYEFLKEQFGELKDYLNNLEGIEKMRLGTELRLITDLISLKLEEKSPIEKRTIESFEKCLDKILMSED